MLETFLVLLAGGIMLAIAIPDPRDVTLNWLRLGGILALVFAGLSAVFIRRMPEPPGLGAWTTWSTVVAAILCQLAFSQVGWRSTQRACALIAFVAALPCAGALQPIPPQPATSSPFMIPGPEIILSWAGIAAMCGIALMDMLIGHAYLTASKMTMAPFQRLNLALSIVLLVRVITNVYAAVREPYWSRDGLLIGTRWFVGLLVPAVFVYMAHDCIKRRSTQSATGILYVGGVLIFIGEIIALQLVRDTGLPF